MIQKRYQFYGKSGIEWTSWFNCCSDDSKLNTLEKYQYGKKLLNEYRIV